MIRNIVGFLLVALGALDLWKFGWAILLHSPQLIFGIFLVFIGGALLSTRRFLP
ncbi:MAG: hypothetical protein KGR26_13885 [Cyanobacteria bacterium REEB65]|nr:hypothetical protein [Cyanobacteria bacterium REEB65]